MKGFLGMRGQLLNKVNTGINFSTAHNESEMAIWISIHNQEVVVPTATATFATSN